MGRVKFLTDCNLEGKQVLLRLDFNVPLTGEQPPKIVDTTRIDLSLPTLQYVLEAGASKIVIISHLGRPKEEKKSEELSMAPVGRYLAEQLGCEVVLSESCTDKGIKAFLKLPQTKVVLLENLRFHPEEVKNDKDFARILASYGDVYVNDAFGVCHRHHASVCAITHFFPKARFGGLLLQKEIQVLEKMMKTSVSPFVGIVGGVKVKDKIGVIERLLVEVNCLLIGGAMAYPFLKAQGVDVGDSVCSEKEVLVAKNILALPTGKKIILPIDHIVSKEELGTPRDCPEQDIPKGMMGLDIGEKTRRLFGEKIAAAKTIFWNGPMGYFENDHFADGTMAIARFIGECSHAFSVVGGGDSLAALNISGVGNKISYVSTGGGALLKFLEEGNLPGIRALENLN